MITETYPQIATILSDARSKILDLSNVENKQMVDKLTNLLTQQINSLKVFSGNFPISTGDKAFAGQPLKRIMGKDVSVVNKETKKVPLSIKQKMQNMTEEHDKLRETQADVEFLEIEKKRDDLYNNFLEMESDKIKDDQPELLIRGVAKKAGIPVTNNLPAKITTEFIEQIKTAIKKKNEEDKSKQSIEPVL